MATPLKYQKRNKRTSAGFHSVTRHLASAQKKIGGKRGFHDQAILLRWPEMVGPEIARIAHPHSVKKRRDGRAVLVLDCVSAYAAEMRMRSDEIAMRVNAHLGLAVIERIDIRHQHIGFAEEKTTFVTATKAKPQERPIPDTLKQNITKTQDSGLREALSALSYSFYQRNGR